MKHARRRLVVTIDIYVNRFQLIVVSVKYLHIINGFAIRRTKSTVCSRLHFDQVESHPRRHARACRGHLRLACDGSARKTWMAGPDKPGTTPSVPG
jgi:hypothetical protein